MCSTYTTQFKNVRYPRSDRKGIIGPGSLIESTPDVHSLVRRIVANRSALSILATEDSSFSLPCDRNSVLRNPLDDVGDDIGEKRWLVMKCWQAVCNSMQKLRVNIRSARSFRILLLPHFRTREPMHTHFRNAKSYAKTPNRPNGRIINRTRRQEELLVMTECLIALFVLDVDGI